MVTMVIKTTIQRVMVAMVIKTKCDGYHGYQDNGCQLPWLSRHVVLPWLSRQHVMVTMVTITCCLNNHGNDGM